VPGSTFRNWPIMQGQHRNVKDLFPYLFRLKSSSSFLGLSVRQKDSHNFVNAVEGYFFFGHD